MTKEHWLQRKAWRGGINNILPRDYQISPLQMQFFAQNASGGALTRWAGTVERVAGLSDQDVSFRDIPFVRGFLL